MLNKLVGTLRTERDPPYETQACFMPHGFILIFKQGPHGHGWRGQAENALFGGHASCFRAPRENGDSLLGFLLKTPAPNLGHHEKKTSHPNGPKPMYKEPSMRAHFKTRESASGRNRSGRNSSGSSTSSGSLCSPSDIIMMRVPQGLQNGWPSPSIPTKRGSTSLRDSLVSQPAFGCLVPFSGSQGNH